jgi:hypothetical protein
MSNQRILMPEIMPGKSITRFHLISEFRHLNESEVHVSHYPDGDINMPAQWYGIYEVPDNHVLEMLRDILHISLTDWMIITNILGSFKWALYKFPIEGNRSEIYVDTIAMKNNEWATTYF